MNNKKLLIRQFAVRAHDSYAVFYPENSNAPIWDGGIIRWGTAKPLVSRMTMDVAWDYMKRIEENWDVLFPAGITHNAPPPHPWQLPPRPTVTVGGFLSYEELGIIEEE